MYADAHSDSTVEPRFNELPRDWGNMFVISRVRYISIQYNEFVEKQPKCSLYRGIVNNCFKRCYVALPSISGSER